MGGTWSGLRGRGRRLLLSLSVPGLVAAVIGANVGVGGSTALSAQQVTEHDNAGRR
jgi:hypothetical protein